MSRTVLDGSLLLAVPIALLAGLVSFASPCVLPLVPGYLGYVTGLTGEDLERRRRGRMLAGALLFVAGFTVVFVSVGWVAGALGDFLLGRQEVIARVLGVVVILMGIVFSGLVPGLQGSRVPSLRPVTGLLGAPLLGVVFALGWTPCIGPTLSAIALLGGIGGDPARGALLALAYCVGLGVPFVAAALAYRRAMSSFDVMRRHHVALMRFGGGMLVVVGVLLVTGVWGELTAQLQGLIGNFEVAV